MRKNTAEKRKYPRIETKNTVRYFLYDDNGKKVDNGKGHTQNLSQSGVLLETDKPLEGVYVVLMTIDLEGKNIRVKGRVAHTRSNDVSGHYLTGIKFLGTEDQQREAIIAFVKVYHHRKHVASQKNKKG
jgi:c-di-GMP-binding flagellar brake protein YcgR